MKTFRITCFLLLSTFILMGASCQTQSLVAPEGPQAAALGKEKDEQIKAQAKQIEDLKLVRETQTRESAKAASSVKGILKANEYVEPALPKEAIGSEAELALKRLPPDDPAETVRALERVVLIITGQRDEALKKYGEASADAQSAKAQIVAKDSEIAKRDDAIKARESQIISLTEAARLEREQSQKNLEALIQNHKNELTKMREEFASKERAQWVLWTRIAGLGLIVIGALVMAVLKALPEGASLVGAGVIIGLVSIFIDWLVSQVWFPWLMGILILLILVAGGYALYRMWKTKTLHAKTVAALQDLKDESAILGNDFWKTTSDHLKYRLGGKDSKWSKEQQKILIDLGLIDPKGEEALTKDSVTTPKS